MALYIVPTPIGNPGDFTLRAIECLRQSDIIIVEEFKESSRNLRSIGIKNKSFEQLNEHSTPEDIKRLVEICRNRMVSLISDSGTPGFSDPGNNLVDVCRKEGIKIHALPGASSLMTILSATGIKMPQFYFRGFLPSENQARKSELEKLKPFKVPIIIMDTPYRLKKTLVELSLLFPHNEILIGGNLTQETEFILQGTAGYLLKTLPLKKAEFILILYP
jgi:16S rRNA (cytidine1402-2'-O)-methyltransferase